MNPHLTIYTDGGAMNGKGGSTLAASAAVLMAGEVPISAVVVTLANATNNQAEMIGLLAAFRQLMPMYRAHTCADCGPLAFGCSYEGHWPGEGCAPGIPVYRPLWPFDIPIYCDSQYVVQGLNEWIKSWEHKGWINAQGKPVMNKPYWLELQKAAQPFPYSLIHLKGHKGTLGNEVADALCTAGIKAQRLVQQGGKPIPPYRVFSMDADPLRLTADGLIKQKLSLETRHTKAMRKSLLEQHIDPPTFLDTLLK